MRTNAYSLHKYNQLLTVLALPHPCLMKHSKKLQNFLAIKIWSTQAFHSKVLHSLALSTPITDNQLLTYL